MAPELQTVFARVRQGERSALEELVTLLYPELRRRAAQYLRRARAHFLATMAQQMRRILVNDGLVAESAGDASPIASHVSCFPSIPRF